jgi:hypothetical protein
MVDLPYNVAAVHSNTTLADVAYLVGRLFWRLLPRNGA